MYDSAKSPIWTRVNYCRTLANFNLILLQKYFFFPSSQPGIHPLPPPLARKRGGTGEVVIPSLILERGPRGELQKREIITNIYFCQSLINCFNSINVLTKKQSIAFPLYTTCPVYTKESVFPTKTSIPSIGPSFLKSSI